MPNDRGEIKRVSFEILYPTGQLKQIHLGIGGIPRWEGAGLIAWSDQVIHEVVLPGISGADGKYGSADEAAQKWDSVDGVFKPAMLLLKEDGATIVACGNHARIWHPPSGETGAPLWPDDFE